MAAQNGHTAIVTLLLQNKADVNQAEQRGHMPLWISALRGHVEVVRVLLSHPNIDIDYQDLSGVTARWAACQNHNSEVVELLLHPRNVVVEVATDARGHQRVVSRTKNPIFDPSALDAAALHGDTFPMINDDGSGRSHGGDEESPISDLKDNNYDVQRVLELETEFLTNIDEKHKHDETATSVSVKFEGELLAKAKQDWIGRLVALQGAGLFRYRDAQRDAQRGHAEALPQARLRSRATASTTRLYGNTKAPGDRQGEAGMRGR